MKKKILLCAVICICLAPICAAQQENAAANEAGFPETFVMDGERTSFAYGRVKAYNKIAIGLADEGVYELRGDSAVWLVNHPVRQDEIICKIAGNFTDNKLFVHVIPDESRTPIDTICVYSTNSSMIFDKAGNITGTIKTDGTVASSQGKTLLTNLHSVDKLLAAFFFVYHYTPIRKQLIINN
ncbi:MAG: hypothetical protein LBS43_12285 [Prevotellaceae bacterium]|jgi:hypothetical protein|nr:hypothetical protein [Prevotellaceae bacterium]